MKFKGVRVELKGVDGAMEDHTTEPTDEREILSWFLYDYTFYGTTVFQSTVLNDIFNFNLVLNLNEKTSKKL